MVRRVAPRRGVLETSLDPSEEETERQAVFNRALLNRGVLAAGNGLMALSTPMTDADIDAIIAAVSGALSEVSASL